MTEPSAQPPTAQSIEEIVRAATAELDSLENLEAVDQWRVSYLGRRGELTTVLRSLSSLDVDQRRTVGASANEAKNTLEERLEERVRKINEAALIRSASQDRLDVTLPGRPALEGRLHPTTQIVREICSAFTAMGFGVVEGPEVEWDHYNFEMLNIPKGHPARDMWNTLWVDYEDPAGEQAMLLRTHTSPMQARVMEGREPPIRVVVPGKCYRYEATDATHEWHFYQVEGLAVGEGITFADLKGPSMNSHAGCSAKSARYASAVTISPSWSPEWTCPSTVFPVMARATVAASAATAAGSRSWAPE